MSSGSNLNAFWPVRGRTIREWRSEVKMASVRHAAARATFIASARPMPLPPSASTCPSATAIAALRCDPTAGISNRRVATLRSMNRAAVTALPAMVIGLTTPPP
ncbi:hypothetical protein SGL43_05992 [Streptomyces globisporus]|uniref:Uncharacterized protein n=1 Tax=Streptomyces globisporus TaxID=1908 RepID=A0ABN8V8F3_STRGL|nr:hypothetical protein SGL43_05992 [Streptomyces globisporus]